MKDNTLLIQPYSMDSECAALVHTRWAVGAIYLNFDGITDIRQMNNETTEPSSFNRRFCFVKSVRSYCNSWESRKLLGPYMPVTPSDTVTVTYYAGPDFSMRKGNERLGDTLSRSALL